MTFNFFIKKVLEAVPSFIFLFIKLKISTFFVITLQPPRWRHQWARRGNGESGIWVNRSPSGPKKQQVKSWVCLFSLSLLYPLMKVEASLFPIFSLLFFSFSSFHFSILKQSNNFTRSQFPQQQPSKRH